MLTKLAGKLETPPIVPSSPFQKEEPKSLVNVVPPSKEVKNTLEKETSVQDTIDISKKRKIDNSLESSTNLEECKDLNQSKKVKLPEEPRYV